MPLSHSASVSSTSRTNACRCLIRLVMTCAKRGSAAPSSFASTASVRLVSVRLRIVVVSSHPLDDHRNALAYTDAHRAQRVAAAGLAQLIDGGGREPRTRCAERM